LPVGFGVVLVAVVLPYGDFVGEDLLVELHIVERASDNTIGRTLKKTFSSRIASSDG
jgi:hypothetical protein